MIEIPLFLLFDAFQETLSTLQYQVKEMGLSIYQIVKLNIYTQQKCVHLTAKDTIWLLTQAFSWPKLGKWMIYHIENITIYVT